MRTARYESHKELGRNLEQDLKNLEGCADCNVLFLEKGSSQLFTIAYTSDDDFRNTGQQLINMGLQAIEKYKINPRQNAGIIASETQRMNKMTDELDLDMAMRTMILSSNQMIRIPSD